MVLELGVQLGGQRLLEARHEGVHVDLRHLRACLRGPARGGVLVVHAWPDLREARAQAVVKRLVDDTVDGVGRDVSRGPRRHGGDIR